MNSGLREIVRFLNDEQIRATYGAVADIVGGILHSIGLLLGPRCAEASWVVNAKTRLPTGYHPSEMHPALLERYEIITSGHELGRRVARWKATR